MKLYYELDLPNVVKKEAKSILNTRKEKFNIVMPEEILTDECISLFNSLGCKPYFVILFQHSMLKSDYNARILHRDITLTSSDPVKWESLSIGINFELTEGHNEFSWYDLGPNPEAFPPDEQIKYSSCRYISAVQCKDLSYRGIPDGAILLDKKVVRKTPVLVRTNVHHITSFEFSEPRNGLSIRFHEESFGRDWDRAVEVIKPIFKK